MQRKDINVAVMLAEAKALRIHDSQAAEAGVSKSVATKREELWLAANREALQSSNAYVEKNGLLLAHHGHF